MLSYLLINESAKTMVLHLSIKIFQNVEKGKQFSPGVNNAGSIVTDLLFILHLLFPEH